MTEPNGKAKFQKKPHPNAASSCAVAAFLSVMMVCITAIIITWMVI